MKLPLSLSPSPSPSPSYKVGSSSYPEWRRLFTLIEFSVLFFLKYKMHSHMDTSLSRHLQFLWYNLCHRMGNRQQKTKQMMTLSHFIMANLVASNLESRNLKNSKDLLFFSNFKWMRMFSLWCHVGLIATKNKKKNPTDKQSTNETYFDEFTC